MMIDENETIYVFIIYRLTFVAFCTYVNQCNDSYCFYSLIVMNVIFQCNGTIE